MQKDMNNAENTESTTRKPVKTFDEVLNTIRDSLSNLANSNNQADTEDDDNNEGDQKQGNLSEDNKPNWVMGTISKLRQYRMECYRQKKMSRAELMQLGWGDRADYIHGSENKYGTAEMKVLAVIKLQRSIVAVAPTAKTFGELMETVDMVSRILHMLQVIDLSIIESIIMMVWVRAAGCAIHHVSS